MSEEKETQQAPERMTHTRPSQPSTRHAIIQLTSLDRYTGLRNHRMRFEDAFDIKGERVDEPNKQDVIFGRGKNLQDLPGNKRMRQITEKYKATYRRLQRSEKRSVVETVYKEIVCNGARFLTKAPNATHYLLVDVEVALQKISNSLRCMKAHKRRLLAAIKRPSSSDEPVPALSVSAAASPTTAKQSSCQQVARSGHDEPPPSKESFTTTSSSNPCPLDLIPAPQNLDMLTSLRYLHHCKRLRMIMGARIMSSIAIGRGIRLQQTQQARPTESDP